MIMLCILGFLFDKWDRFTSVCRSRYYTRKLFGGGQGVLVIYLEKRSFRDLINFQLAKTHTLMVALSLQKGAKL